MRRNNSKDCKFNLPARAPKVAEERLMVALLLEDLVRIGMEKNIYNFNSEIKICEENQKQSEGSSGEHLRF